MKKEEKLYIPLRLILAEHYVKTGEYITQKMLANELVEKRIFKNIHVAQNTLQYYMQGKRRPNDKVIEYLKKRFNKPVTEIIKIKT